MSDQLILEFVTVKILFLKLTVKQCQVLCRMQIWPYNNPIRQILLFHFIGEQLKPKEMKSFSQSSMAGKWWCPASGICFPLKYTDMGDYMQWINSFKVKNCILKLVPYIL